MVLSNGQRLPTYSIEGTQIADLSLEKPKTATTTTRNPTSVPDPRQSFTDPAILSFSKPSFKQVDYNQQGKQLGATGRAAAPEEEDELEEEETERKAKKKNTRRPVVDFQTQPPSPITTKKKTTRRGWEAGNVRGHVPTTSTNIESTGWRQTAFVEPAPPHRHGHDQDEERPRQHVRRGKKGSGRSGKHTTAATTADDVNNGGWATEDAMDIQEMGEFDFQSNLSKFDKGRIFEQFRNGDTTAEEARLVSINKLAKPGTNGGKNLHWSENVLDSPTKKNDDLVAETEEEEEEEEEEGDFSRRRKGSRKGSSIMTAGAAAQTLILPPQISSIVRTQRAASRTSSPRSGDQSASASLPISAAATSRLQLTTTNRACPSLSPLQALEIEQLAISELGLTDEIITENAGRGIAEAAVSQLQSQLHSDSAAAAILILTANHRTGARAMTAARHLRNRGHRATVCMLGLEHESELLESCRKQLDILQKCGGRVIRCDELVRRLSTPSEFRHDLIVDALFGIHLAFEDLRSDEQAAAFEMISWINRSSVDVLSVDVPSGISASSGTCTSIIISPFLAEANPITCNTCRRNRYCRSARRCNVGCQSGGSQDGTC